MQLNSVHRKGQRLSYQLWSQPGRVFTGCLRKKTESQDEDITPLPNSLLSTSQPPSPSPLPLRQSTTVNQSLLRRWEKMQERPLSLCASQRKKRKKKVYRPFYAWLIPPRYILSIYFFFFFLGGRGSNSPFF